jgi:hypothetical protein
MEQRQPQDSSTDRWIRGMARVAETELDRMVHSSETVTDRLVEMVADSEQLRLERNKLQLELARANSLMLTRLSIQLNRAWWNLHQVLRPVGATRSRALQALAFHQLDPVAGARRLFFDPAWYFIQLQGVGSESPPEHEEWLLGHYVAKGEVMGLWPTSVFDPQFYAVRTGVALGRGRAILHFLEHGLHLAVAPRAGLEDMSLRAFAAGQTPAAWLFMLAVEPLGETWRSRLTVECRAVAD